MSSVVIDQSECLNCGAELHGEFCSRCGQKTGSPNPTFHDLVHDFTHETLHVDGRLGSSLRLLFTKPGFLGMNFGLNAVAALLRFAHWTALDGVWLALSFVILVWYVTAAMKRVYGRSTRVALRRSLTLLFMYAVAVAITFGIFVVVALRV